MITVPTILILESDQNVARDLSRRLLALGYPLMPIVESEREALLAIQEGKPELILLDLHFGGTDTGPKLAALIRKSYDLPIIFILQAKNAKAFNHADLTDAYGFIVTPFDNTSIRAIVGQASNYHQKEKTIRESQNQMAAVLKSIGDGIITVDEQGVIQFINSIAINLTGLSETSALGVSLDNVVTVIDKPTQRPIKASELIRNRRSTGPLFGFEVILLGPNSILIPVDCSVAPLRDHRGLSAGAVIAFRSLSEIQHSLEESKTQAARSEALLRIIAHINSKLKIDEILTSFLQELTKVLDADAAAVFLADGEDGLFRIVSTHTLNEHLHAYPIIGFELKLEVIDELFAQNQSVVYFPNIQELINMPYHALFLQEDIRSMVLVKNSLYENNCIGMLVIITTGRDRNYSREELQFIKGLADYASVAIATGRLFETLRASRSRLQMVTKRLVEVQEAERRAVARELHDQVGQVLTGLQFSLETGKRSAEGNLRTIFEDSQKLVTSLMQEIRELSLKLSPSMLDDMGLLRTLLWHFEQYKTQTGIQVNFSQNGLERRFPPEIEITAYRILQEALTNVARYAKVDKVDVEINADDELLRLQVKDLGCGFDPQKTVQRKTTFGLTSMKERTFLVGGQLSIKTAPGRGTELLAVLPISGFLERRRYDR